MSEIKPDSQNESAADYYGVNLDESAVAVLAAALADTAPPTGLVFLQGGLGAGKTTFSRAFLRQMGVTGPVRSPTYTLIEPYDISLGDLPARRVLHLDLYRLAVPEELDDLGLRDEFDQSLLLIEWPERGEGELPAADLVIVLQPAADDPMRRNVRLQARSERAKQWLAACEGSFPI
jgi:tRNA threonylcarbamoyladenosine biosynthesis protein TsaE